MLRCWFESLFSMTLLPGSLRDMGNEEGGGAVRQPPPSWGEVQRGHALLTDTAAAAAAAAVRQPSWGAVQRGNIFLSHLEASGGAAPPARHPSSSAVDDWGHSHQLAGVGPPGGPSQSCPMPATSSPPFKTPIS